ncbi:5657_t:CDS:2, partial [Entrophospora sp. SA101]
FLQNIKDAFVKSAARRRRYITHLKHHGIVSPCKIPLPNATRWNSWFKMVLYTKEYINYWPHFFESELQENSNNTLLEIHNTLQNEHERGIITIYVYFISIFSQEFIQTLDFFQQKNLPVFPYIETRLQHLTAYLESNRTAENFGSGLDELILTVETLVTTITTTTKDFVVLRKHHIRFDLEKSFVVCDDSGSEEIFIEIDNTEIMGIINDNSESLLAIESRLMDPDEAIHDDARLPLPDLSFNFFEKQFDGLENKDVRIHTLNHIHNAVNQR